MKSIETIIPFKLLIIPEKEGDVVDEVEEAANAFASVLERRRTNRGDYTI